MPSVRRLFPLFVIALAAACAAPPVITGAARDRLWQQHRDAVIRLDKWEAHGRIAVRIGSKGWTASLNWRQAADAYDASVYGPFGSNRYELRGGDGSVQLHTADNRVLTAGNAENLMQRSLGWGVPVAGFIYWIRGVPAPDSSPSSMALDDHGRLTGLDQDGWQIRYEDYVRSGGLELPGRITLVRDDLHLKLVIHDWAV